MIMIEMLEGQKRIDSSIVGMFTDGTQAARRESWETETRIRLRPDGGVQYMRFFSNHGWPWIPKAADLAADDWVGCR